MTPHELEVWLREAAATITPMVPNTIGLVMVAIHQEIDARDGDTYVTFHDRPIVYTNLPPEGVDVLVKALAGMRADVKKLS